MSHEKNFQLLGVWFNAESREGILTAIREAEKEDRAACVSFTNVSVLVAADKDPDAARALNAASANCIDGMPICWVARRRGHPQAVRNAGPDIMDALLRDGLARGSRHYFYGTTEKTLALLTDKLAARYPGIVIAGTWAPPYRPLTQAEDAEDIARLRDAHPDYVWVGLGAPKQDLWMQAHADSLPGCTLLGVGAAFDFFAGTVRRAPGWMQRSGLEWLYRLVREPRRLWKRYIGGNAYFLWRLLREKGRG